ncbi:SPOR domain-containing protein [Bacteroidota bacterium]
MKKQLIILICLAAIPLFGQEEVFDLKLNTPSSVVAGNDFEVSVTFNKGELKDYSRFSQDLPSGFTAENIFSPNADFTFADQRVRIIWLKLPPEDHVEVKYSINVHERLKGTLELYGTFAYVQNGQRAFLDLTEPKKVEILPNPYIDQSLIVDIADFHTITTPVNVVYPEENIEKEDFATIVRQSPVVDENGVVYVALLLKQPEGTNYLKLKESIPDGYFFEALNSTGGAVTQSSSRAEFVWSTPPQDDSFVVKYRLVPILDRNQGALNMEGNLTLNEAGELKEFDVREMNVNIEAMNDSQKREFLSTGKVPAGLPIIEKKSVNLKGDKEVPAREQQKQVRKEVNTTSPYKYKKSTGPSFIDIEPLEGEKGVYFRVQVAAIKKPYFARIIFADYEILHDVKIEDIDGWHKYTVGSRYTFEEAVQLKNRVRAETPEIESFIVAFKDSRRVPLADVIK